MPEKMDKISGQSGGHYSFCSQYIAINLEDIIISRLYGNQNFDDFDDTLLYTRIHHETCHYIQNVTTSYGLLKTSLLRIAGLCFFNGFTNQTGLGRKVPPQFDDLVPRGRIEPGSEYSPFIMGHLMIQVLDALENQSGLVDVPMPIGVVRPKGQANPFVSYNGTMRAITAAMLLEFQAYSIQTYTLDNMSGIPKHHADYLVGKIRENGHIRVPWSLVAHSFGVDKISAEIHLLTYELVTLALSPQVDLTPSFLFAPVKRARRGRGMINWEELHPGWRFIRMMELIRDKGLQVPQRDDVKGFANDVAKLLGWNLPGSTLSRALDTASELPTLLDDFVANRASILRFIDDDQPSFSLQGRWLTEGGVRCRGPRSDPDDEFVLQFALYDACVQYQYSKDLFCPICISDRHKNGCPIDFIFERLSLGVSL